MLAWGSSRKEPKHVAILGCWWLYMLLCFDGINQFILFLELKHSGMSSIKTKTKTKVRTYMVVDSVFLVCIVDKIYKSWIEVVCILLGISLASDCGLPTFRNPLSVPSSRAGCKVWSITLYQFHLQGLDVKYEVYFILYIQPLKMELIKGSETLANHNRTPGKYPKEYIHDSKHGESLKSWIEVAYFRLFREQQT